MQIQFGALATQGQAVAARERAKKLFGEETANGTHKDLTFFKEVTGLTDWNNTINEVGRDGQTLEENVETLRAQGGFPSGMPAYALYMWHFPSRLLALAGRATVEAYKLKQADPGAHTVKLDGDVVLLRSRIPEKVSTLATE